MNLTTHEGADKISPARMVNCKDFIYIGPLSDGDDAKT
ncbi:hypothetical protein SAMN05444273_10629 [Litoreibacter ascidiaceicola]|uniref:Uncharacterized protein n=1 Tax=Litoreibacter ascidiaceicola TaxID=1486859 RepID=A0A1M5BKY5_9RHOB|nr:hypothetical protein SAMN05444273_10629 [Litoreibacter ascidiaceicola]